LCNSPYVLQHRAAEADVKVCSGERQHLVRLNTHKFRPREDRLEGGTILDRSHGNVTAVGIPELQKIRVWEMGVGCHATIEQAPAGRRPGERDKACVNTTASVERNARGKATEGTLRVEVIYGIGCHRTLPYLQKTVCPGAARHTRATRPWLAIPVPR